jgi:phage-related protein
MTQKIPAYPDGLGKALQKPKNDTKLQMLHMLHSKTQKTPQAPQQNNPQNMERTR